VWAKVGMSPNRTAPCAEARAISTSDRSLKDMRPISAEQSLAVTTEGACPGVRGVAVRGRS
jgi:hypothetical protein